MGTAIAALTIALSVAMAIRKLYKDRKNGAGCGRCSGCAYGSCSGCGYKHEEEGSK